MSNVSTSLCWECDRTGCDKTLQLIAKDKRLIPKDLIPCSWILYGKIPEGAEYEMHRKKDRHGEWYDNPCITSCPHYVHTKSKKEKKEHTVEQKPVKPLPKQVEIKSDVKCEPVCKRTGRNIVPIRCVETGEIFSNIYEAAKAMGFSYDSLKVAVRREHKVYHGLHWEILNKEQMKEIKR